MKSAQKARLVAVAVFLGASSDPGVAGVSAAEPPTRIEVRADLRLGAIEPRLLGVNHRYPFSGFGAWDSASGRVFDGVVARSREIGFGVGRFPGGTVSSTYHWIDGIGPPEARPTGILAFDGRPVANDYGLDEHQLFMEQVGAETNVVVNFGTATAQEAAAMVAYATGDPADARPLGIDRRGVDWGTVGQWAALREANQDRLGVPHHPYAIKYWEVGNELYGDWELTWTHDAVRYALGGAEWQYVQHVVQAGDWTEGRSYSDGLPSQSRFVLYPPVTPGTALITVDGAAWTEVPALATAGPQDTVFELDPTTGEIRFGDGAHGAIPAAGTLILATFLSGPHDGFGDYYGAMKKVNPAIKVGSCFPTSDFLAAMGSERPYDFVAVHLYEVLGRDKTTGLSSAHLAAMGASLQLRDRIEDLRGSIDAHAGERADQVEIAVTEYNLIVPESSSPTPFFGMSLDQALFVADALRVLIAEGVAVANLHNLISLTAGNGWWENTALMSPQPDLVLRAAGYAFRIFTHLLAAERVHCRSSGVPELAASIPALEALAAIDPDGRRLTIAVINKSADDAMIATVDLAGFVPAPAAAVYTLNGAGITAFNDPEHPFEVTISESTLSGVARSFEYAFPAHSVTVLELTGAGPLTRRATGRLKPEPSGSAG